MKYTYLFFALLLPTMVHSSSSSSIQNAKIFNQTIKNGWLDVAQKMIEKNPALVNHIYEGKTPLQRALESDDYDQVRFLLDHGAKADLISWFKYALSDFLKNPVRYFTLFRRYGTDIQPLVQYINAKHKSVNDVLLRLFYGYEHGQISLQRLDQLIYVLKALGADIGMKDESNSTLLLRAVQHNRADLVHVLLDNGVDLYEANDHGDTAWSLHFYASPEVQQIIKLHVNRQKELRRN